MTTRAVTAAADTALRQPTVRPALLIEMQFSGGPVRLWTGLGDLTWNGNVFTGAGDLLAVSPIEETAEVASKGITLTLSGLPTSLVATLDGEAWQNRPARVWLALFDEDGVTMIDDPVPIMRGRMDQITHTEGETATVALTIESRLADLERPRIRRYTAADHEAEYPGDLAFAFVEDIANGVDISW